MEQIINKVERYIQLSKKFQKAEVDIFGNSDNSNILIGTTIEYTLTGYSQQQNVVIKEKTRAEKIRETAEIIAKLAEDYDEYLQLQKDLGDYFSSLNKLTK